MPSSADLGKGAERALARARDRWDEGGSSGHGGGGGRWLVSYADFVTLMFGFFLILWASADPNQANFARLAEALHKAFNNGAMIGQAGSGQIAGQGGREAPIQVSQFTRVSETTGELVAQMGLQDQVSVGMKREGLVITLSDSLLFDVGSATVRPEAKEVLGRLATVFAQSPGNIRIEGHTDNVPPTPSFPSNWELSARRAAGVLRYFTETVGLPADRFEAAGYGEFRPVAPNDTREGRAKNRRVEIVLLSPTGTATPQAGASP